MAVLVDINGLIRKYGLINTITMAELSAIASPHHDVHLPVESGEPIVAESLDDVQHAMVSHVRKTYGLRPYVEIRRRRAFDTDLPNLVDGVKHCMDPYGIHEEAAPREIFQDHVGVDVGD
jgi:hypothetical protein